MQAVIPSGDWDDLRFFLAVARRGTVRGAAMLLKVNQSTISRRLCGFEAYLGVRLFERLPGGYVMTPTGEEVFEMAQRVEEEMAALERSVAGRDTQLRGSVRVTLPEPFATSLLMPDFAQFAKLYPEIELDIVTSYEPLNLSKREADVAIRITQKPPDTLVGRKLVTSARAIYASHQYLANHKIDGDPALLNWIGWDDEVPTPRWVKESPFPNVLIRHRIRDPEVQLEAVKAGMGLTILPCMIGDQDPALRRVFPDHPPMESTADVWILTHEDLRKSARIVTFMDFIAEAILAHRSLLEGHRPIPFSE